MTDALQWFAEYWVYVLVGIAIGIAGSTVLEAICRIATALERIDRHLSKISKNLRNKV